jgi:type IV pilus assembly protein PilA
LLQPDLGADFGPITDRSAIRSAPMPHAIRDERGFTLIELLVVILIIGILAAIALPSFLDQQKKAQDADAKTVARHLVTKVEACFADEMDYNNCTPAGIGVTDLPIGNGRGEVDLTAKATDTYTVTAFSKSGNTFLVTKDATTGLKRTCTGSSGGCPAGKTW